jgi:hypothetical protein
MRVGAPTVASACRATSSRTVTERVVPVVLTTGWPGPTDAPFFAFTSAMRSGPELITAPLRVSAPVRSTPRSACHERNAAVVAPSKCSSTVSASP